MTGPDPPPSGCANNASGLAEVSAASPEKNASSLTPASTDAPKKPRSCATCRTRKVRCDKKSPCSNCRRAKIACVVPSDDKPPRWARQLERSGLNAQDGPGAAVVMNRLRRLESMVKDLTAQLEQAHTSPSSHDAHSSPASSESTVQSGLGRLIIGDTSSRYISSNFWSRVTDELGSLKMDTEALAQGNSSTDEDWNDRNPRSHELDRTPLERNEFMFGHSAPVDLRLLHPLPSQIPFILSTFQENINCMGQAVHMPTINNMIRMLPGNKLSSLSSADEALMFSIYYATITSMDDEEVQVNFGSSQAELGLKYRLGFEHALAKSDFLNVPDIVLVQAMTIFLWLVRRHDSPRYVWMMTGLVIRMAQGLGMHRDGTNFAHLTPYEIEMRRKLWAAVCMLDMRASDDQDMDLTIHDGSFDTRLPLNINDADISPETKDMPEERVGIADVTISLAWYKQGAIMRQIFALLARKSPPASMTEKMDLLAEVYTSMDRNYLQLEDPANSAKRWMCETVTKLVTAKLALIMYLPELLAQPDQVSDDMRAKLLVAATEVAEYNHSLNDSHSSRRWRWIYQTYTHWHAIVFMLMTAAQQPWSAAVERAWVALHSKWLIPKQRKNDSSFHTWLPLRKLMAAASRHRASELERLRGNAQAAQRLEDEYRSAPQPKSLGPLPGENYVELFRQQWRRLVESEEHSMPTTGAQAGYEAPFAASNYSSEPSNILDSVAYDDDFLSWQWSNTVPSVNALADVDVNELDMTMELDDGVDWNTWFQTAKSMELKDYPSR